MFRPKWWMILLVVILVLGAVASMFVRFSPNHMGFVPADYVERFESGEGDAMMYGRGSHYPMMRSAAPFALGGFFLFGVFRTLLIIGVVCLLVRLIFGRRWHRHHMPPHGYRGKPPYPPHGWYCGPYPGAPHAEEECPMPEPQENDVQTEDQDDEEGTYL